MPFLGDDAINSPVRPELVEGQVWQYTAPSNRLGIIVVDQYVVPPLQSEQDPRILGRHRSMWPLWWQRVWTEMRFAACLRALGRPNLEPLAPYVEHADRGGGRPLMSAVSHGG